MSKLILMALGLLSASGAFASTTFTNGSFETASVPAHTYILGSNASATGWVLSNVLLGGSGVGASTVTYDNKTGTAEVGSNFGILYGQGAMSQTFSATKGQYAISFGLEGFPSTFFPANDVTATFDGQSLTASAIVPTANKWTDYSYLVNVSTTGNHTLAFTGKSMLGITLIDNVAVTPVPEPETYAMLLAGLGLIGTIVRRRNKSWHLVH